MAKHIHRVRREAQHVVAAGPRGARTQEVACQELDILAAIAQRGMPMWIALRR